MARRHFDARGYPKLEMIIQEMQRYLKKIKVEYIESNLARIIDTNFPTSSDKRVIFGQVELANGMPTAPFTLKSVTVVGGQVAYLPESFNTGSHDLDIYVTFHGGSQYLPV